MTRRLFHCGKRDIDLRRSDIEFHHCFNRQKGNNKGQRCKYLIESYVP
jgi:hypothetical protein